MTTFESLLNAPNELLVIHKTLVRVLGFGAAVFISRLHFWMGYNTLAAERKDTHFHNGKWWVYNTAPQWTDDMGIMSSRSVERIIALLEKLELIESDNFNKVAYDRTKWYTINYDACERFLALWFDHGEPVHSGARREDFLAAWQDAVAASRQVAGTAVSRQVAGNNTDKLPGYNSAKLSGTIPVVTSSNTVKPTDARSSNPADLPSGHRQARRAPGKKNRLASTNPYLQGSVSIPESSTAALKSESRDSTLTGRALYRWLVTKANNGRPLKKSVVGDLQGKIVILGGYGSKTEYPNLLDCYDILPGFALFCEESLEMFVRTRGGLENVDASHLISFLRDFANVKDGKTKRWFAWAASNPEQCVPVETPSESDLEAQREADALQAQRDAEHAIWKIGFDAREKECAVNWEVPDNERPEHLRGLSTADEWDYYTRHNLTLAQQQEMAANGTLPNVWGWS